VGRSPFQYKMCIVIRTDLGMSAGKMIAQACHAAVGANEEAKRLNHKAWRKWREEGAKKVALEAESLEDMHKVVDKIDEQIKEIKNQKKGAAEEQEKETLDRRIFHLEAEKERLKAAVALKEAEVKEK